jgi:ribosomal-protein-alanine N-acetyltransferase
MLTFQNQDVLLRAFETQDVEGLLTYLNHPALAGRRYLPWGFPGELPLSRQQVEKAMEKWRGEERGAHLAITLRVSGELIGHAAMTWGWDPHCPDVALVIAPAHQRQGYGSDTLAILLRYLFENTPAHNVSSWMGDWNEAARAFAQAHSFQECGRWRRDGLRLGAYYDTVQVDLLKAEWLALQKKEVGDGAGR